MKNFIKNFITNFITNFMMFNILCFFGKNPKFGVFSSKNSHFYFFHKKHIINSKTKNLSYMTKKNSSEVYKNKRDYLRSMVFYLLYILLVLDPTVHVIFRSNTRLNRSFFGKFSNLNCTSIMSKGKFVFKKWYRYRIQYLETRGRRGKRITKFIQVNKDGPVVDCIEDRRLGEFGDKNKLIMIMVSLINIKLAEKNSTVRYTYDTPPTRGLFAPPAIKNLRMVFGNVVEHVENDVIDRIAKNMNYIISSFYHIGEEGQVVTCIGNVPTTTATGKNKKFVFINGESLVVLVKRCMMK